MRGLLVVLALCVVGRVVVGCGSSSDGDTEPDGSSEIPVDASSDGNSVFRDATSDATRDAGRDLDGTIKDGTIADDGAIDDASDNDATDADNLDAGDAADADPCAGFVADTSCFLSGACAAGNVASSCHGGVIVPCVTGSPTGVSETICNSIDDNCNGSTDELASAASCPKVVNVVIVYDAQAAVLFPDTTDVISSGFDSAAAKFTAASNPVSGTGFTPKVALNLAAQISWSVIVPSDFMAPTSDPVDAPTLLSNFTTWVGAHRTDIGTMAGEPADYVILVTGHPFASGSELAWDNALCTSNDTAVITAQAMAFDFAASLSDHFGSLIAQAIGLNFGLPRDGTTGSVMSFVPAANAMFSAASITAMNTYFTSSYPSTSKCLDDEAPLVAWPSQHCGDGRKGPRETCDPGVGITDACCTSSCQLGASCACADTEACCNAGVIVSAASGRVCRAASGTCDVADVCDGVSSDCPFDAVQVPGGACTSSGGFAGNCYEGSCVSGQQILNEVSGVTTDTFCDSPVPTASLCDQLNFNMSGSTACNIAYVVSPPTGLVCGAAEQCAGGTCKASSALTAYAWTTSPWSTCSSGYQTRTAACVDETGASALSSSCVSTQPLTLRGCP